MEILKQGQYKPLDVENQVMIIYAATNDLLADVPLGQIQEFEKQLFSYMEDHYPEVKRAIRETGDLSAETESLMKKGIKEFKKVGLIHG